MIFALAWLWIFVTSSSPSRDCHYYLCWILGGYHGHSAVFWPCPRHPHLISVSRHQRISNLAPHPRHQLDFAGAFINVHVSRYWRCEVHKIFYDLCHHLSASDLDRRLCGRVSRRGLGWHLWCDDTETWSCMPPYAAVCYRLFLLSQPAAATIVPTTIKMISQFVRYEQTQHQHLLTLWIVLNRPSLQKSSSPYLILKFLLVFKEPIKGTHKAPQILFSMKTCY